MKVAYNAMRTQQLEEQLTSAKKTAIQNTCKVRSAEGGKVVGTGVVSVWTYDGLSSGSRKKALQKITIRQTNKYKEVSYYWGEH